MKNFQGKSQKKAHAKKYHLAVFKRKTVNRETIRQQKLQTKPIPAGYVKNGQSTKCGNRTVWWEKKEYVENSSVGTANANIQ